jgi:PAS domain S-box-containing protein
VRLALAGAPGYVEFDEPVHGTRVLAGYAPVPGLGWAVVEQVPASEAYAGLARLTAVLIVLSGVLLGGILLASVVLARRIVAPVRELTTVAGAFAAGRLRARAEPAGDDEIAELGRTFNTMADRIGESLEGLRRSEARYRNLVESANDLVLTIEPGGDVSFAGPQAERLLGWDAAALMGQPFRLLVRGGDEARFRDALTEVLRTGAPVAYLPHLLTAADGQRRAFRSNLSPIFGPDGKALRVLVVSRDVTAEQREERLREQSFLMARLVSEAAEMDRLARDGLAIALATVGATGGAVHIQAQEGLRVAASVGADGREAAAAAVREGRAAQRDGVLAVPLLERGEALGALVVQPAPPAEERDALTALASQLAVGIRRSLFEQRLREYASELEARVAARTAELQAKNEEIESFLYRVSHDLKAPLISIEGYAQGLEEDYASVLDDMGRQYLDRIRKNATLMEKLILDLLELSRIGRVRSAVEDVDTLRVVQDVAARLEDRYAAQGGGIHVDPGLPRVRGERNRIEQLFGNLLENALKYRHPDRAPRVDVRGEATPEGGVLLTVADNGRGIPQAHRDALFKIFQRLPTPHGMPDPGGTGMGLAIVKRIVDTHGGKVWVEGEEGTGTTFRILLPRLA